MKIRSVRAWKAYVDGPMRAAAREADRVDRLIAGWRERAAKKVLDTSARADE